MLYGHRVLACNDRLWGGVECTGVESGDGVIAKSSYVWFLVKTMAGVGARGTVSPAGVRSSVISTSARAQGAKTAKASNTRERNIKKIVLRGKTDLCGPAGLRSKGKGEYKREVKGIEGTRSRQWRPPLFPNFKGFNVQGLVDRWISIFHGVVSLR